MIEQQQIIYTLPSRGLWADLRPYRGDELKEAVSRGYIELERNRDHIVTVTSKINEYKLTVGADENSQITEPKQAVTTFTYDAGKSLVVKFKANTGYRISNVIVDDVSLEGAELLKALAYHSVSVDRKGDHSVFVESSPLEFTLTTGSGAAGTPVCHHFKAAGHQGGPGYGQDA